MPAAVARGAAATSFCRSGFSRDPGFRESPSRLKPLLQGQDLRVVSSRDRHCRSCRRGSYRDPRLPSTASCGVRPSSTQIAIAASAVIAASTRISVPKAAA